MAASDDENRISREQSIRRIRSRIQAAELGVTLDDARGRQAPEAVLQLSQGTPPPLPSPFRYSEDSGREAPDGLASRREMALYLRRTIRAAQLRVALDEDRGRPTPEGEDQRLRPPHADHPAQRRQVRQGRRAGARGGRAQLLPRHDGRGPGARAGTGDEPASVHDGHPETLAALGGGAHRAAPHAQGRYRRADQPAQPAARVRHDCPGYRGLSLHDLQDSMGHADPRTTRRYDRARNNLHKSAGYDVAKALA